MVKYSGECLAKLIRFQSRIRSSSIIYAIARLHLVETTVCGYHAWSLYVHTLKSHDCFTRVLTGDLLHMVINKITHKKACVQGMVNRQVHVWLAYVKGHPAIS